MRKVIALMLALIASVVSFDTAFASGMQIEAQIPVTSIGPKGHYVLMEEDKVIDEVTLFNGQTDYLKVTLCSLDNFHFIVKQTEGDDPEVIYDNTVYDIEIMTLLDEKESPTYVFTAKEKDEDTKTDKIKFVNYVDIEVPQTGDENDIMKWGYIGFSAVFIGTIVLVFARQERKDDTGDDKSGV